MWLNVYLLLSQIITNICLFIYHRSYNKVIYIVISFIHSMVEKLIDLLNVLTLMGQIFKQCQVFYDQ